MQLSTRGRYAVMAMIDLATLSHSGCAIARPVTLAHIAQRQRISLSYLEQLFAKLRKGGVVESVRGPGGGYMLAKSLEQTWLADIIAAVDEPVDLTRCGLIMGEHNPQHPTTQGCVGGHKCNAHDLWAAMGHHMEEFMARVSLRMILDGALAPRFTPVEGTTVRITIN